MTDKTSEQEAKTFDDPAPDFARDSRLARTKSATPKNPVTKTTAMRNTARAITTTAVLAMALSGCVFQPAIRDNTTPSSTSTPSSPESGSISARSTPDPAPSSPEQGKELNPANEDLDWANGQRLRGDGNGGYTPDFSNGMGDPSSGWAMDASKISDGVITFTSETTKCTVKTLQYRDKAPVLVPGDDRESSVNVLSTIFKDDPASVRANAAEIDLSYGLIGAKHTVTLMAGTSHTSDGYYYTAARAFSKAGVVLVVDSLCPTPETRQTTIKDIHDKISINGL